MKGKSEIFIGIVSPVGVDLQQVENYFRDLLGRYQYNVESIKMSDIIRKFTFSDIEINNCTDEFERINNLMTAGNYIREVTEMNDVLACLAMHEIKTMRGKDEPRYNYTYLFNSLKTPEEIYRLREIYGDGFYLVGIASSYTSKLKFLNKRKHIPEDKAKKLINRDESEDKKYGQNTRDAFQLSDVFIDFDREDLQEQFERFLELIFGNFLITPSKDEYAMFLAFAASLRSADLSRQVGAVITSSEGELISTGANDVPRFGGGLYWADHEDDNRDYILGYDTNEWQRNKILLNIMKKFKSSEDKTNEELIEEGRNLLKDTEMLDITEYGRPVHAEMECLLSCARSGISPKSGTLYCTTFPCHNCTKHIIASGIKRVVFIEPYPKSKSKELYGKEIFLKNEDDHELNKEKSVEYEPFVGIGPRKFIDLFSISLSRGRKIKRKENGKVAKWDPSKAEVRTPLLPVSYIENETKIITEVDNKVSNKIGGDEP